jgi:hypothetical protein
MFSLILSGSENVTIPVLSMLTFRTLAFFCSLYALQNFLLFRLDSRFTKLSSSDSDGGGVLEIFEFCCRSHSRIGFTATLNSFRLSRPMQANFQATSPKERFQNLLMVLLTLCS